MAYLYKNVKGYEVKSHSYSGGLNWSCPKRYYWSRIEGWQSREDRVAIHFGYAVEDSIQYFHNRNFESGSGVDEFKKLWFLLKDNTEISYTEKSGTWEDHYRMGKELLSLYEMTLPELPISNAKFQVEYSIPLFDKDDPKYGGLRYRGKVDMLCTAPNNHPLLPAVDIPESTREFIVDLKTSGNPYHSDPRMSSLDAQLRDYSWMSGLSTVAFLVLVKNYSEVMTGDWITVLKGPKSGKKYQVFDNDGTRVLTLPKALYDEYQDRNKAIKGKGAKEQKEMLMTEYFYKGQSFLREDVTKQRIQFLPAIISKEDAAEARREAIHEAMDIADHSRENYFPKKPGIRFPHNQCLSCEMLPLCMGDKETVKEKLIQIGGEF